MPDGLGIVAPLLQELHALGKQAGLQRTVFVIGIETGKLVQVLPFGSHLLTLEGNNLLPQADVVIALGHRPAEFKLPGECPFQEVDSWLTEVDDAERLVMGKALVAQGADDIGKATVSAPIISGLLACRDAKFCVSIEEIGQARMLNALGHWRQRHGVGVLPVIDEPQLQASLDDGILQPVAVPREQVHAAPFAALDIVPPQIRADDLQVLKAYRLKLNHQVPCGLLLGRDVVSQ